MALVRWRDRELEPADTFDWLQEQINDLFEDFPRWPGTRGLFERTISPAVDVIEGPERYTVECELPGMDEKGIEVSIAGGVLTIKGEKKGQQESRGGKVYRKESWEGSFQRTLSLPRNVDSGKIEASYKDGVLKVVLPKSESAKAKRIPLKTRALKSS